MKLVRITAFVELGQDALAVYAVNVATLMSENALFSKFSVEVAELKTLNEAYAIALTNNILGGPLTTIEKDKCKAAVTAQLKVLAALVDIFAKGDESIILAAGFDLRAAATVYTALPAPVIKSVTNELEPGVISLEFKKVNGANNYGIEKRIKTEGGVEGPWMNGEYSTAAKTQLKNLESNKVYQIRIRGVGSKGLVSPFSAIVELLVY